MRVEFRSLSGFRILSSVAKDNDNRLRFANANPWSIRSFAAEIQHA